MVLAVFLQMGTSRAKLDISENCTILIVGGPYANPFRAIGALGVEWPPNLVAQPSSPQMPTSYFSSLSAQSVGNPHPFKEVCINMLSILEALYLIEKY